MAQLVKLQDYVSRYQIDLARYPTQFVHLKKVQWERVKNQWIAGDVIQQWEHVADPEEEQPSSSPLSFIKKWLPKKQPKIEQLEDIESVDVSTELLEGEIPDEATTLTFEPNIVYHPETLEELKKMFLDQFFHFQLKWASSTLREKSYIDPKFLRDGLLRAILQQLPDNYLLFYYPIVQVKKAPIELDVILLTPIDCLCITVLEEENAAVYVGDGDRFWTKKVGKQDVKVLNPFIQLNRMESVVSNIFAQNDVKLPIRKVLLTRNGYFDYPGSPFNIQLVDKREYPAFMQQLRRLSSPMKHGQIQAAQAILKTVQTTSYNRDVWTVRKPDI